MIVVPVDEAVAFTASVLEQLLRAIDDRLARDENAAEVAAAVAQGADPGQPDVRIPVIAGVEQTPLSFITALGPDDLVRVASEAIATDAPFEVSEAVETVGDELLPGDSIDAG